MKKWIAVLLAVLTVLTFTACNEEGPSHTPAPSASAAGQSGQSVAETLTKAAEKTGNAKSFVLTYGTKMELSETVNDYTKTFSAVTDSDGNMTALCVQPVYDYETGNTVEKVMYISGNYAYEENPVAYSRYTKYVSDTALAQYLIASEFDGFITNENFLTDFAAMKPASDRQENGSVCYSVTGLSLKDAYALIMGDTMPEDMETETIGGMKIENTTVSVTVDGDGYLSGFSYVASGYYEEADKHGSVTTLFSLEQLDREVTVQKPDFIDRIEESKDWTECRIIENGLEVIYGSDYESGYVFRGPAYRSQYTEVYKILAEIDGKPVTLATDNRYYGHIGKLVLPEGVSFRGGYYDSNPEKVNIELYFESTEESVRDGNCFNIIGQESDDGFMAVKAAYYAGEWEYVDGVPTPVR
ncbi:MAG: hypothetical protein PUC05_04460 [Firmicutes bacterium]|nr:hypothetical protein [Bacillota bacterium]